MKDQPRIAVIGLGYVGLPLALAFGSRHPTLGFDIDAQRVAELGAGVDRHGEHAADELRAAGLLRYTADRAELAAADVYCIAVPTPVDRDRNPDFAPLLAASEMVGERMQAGAVVIYESTVYPGATEEICVPALERSSGLRCNRDFHVGYSPERINPGDRQRRLPDIVKVTSGSTPQAAEYIDRLYREIVPAGTHRAPSIRVAEAAKAVENTQRDVNIALMNELLRMFRKLGIDTQAVLDAAATKWNFLPFRPGLVGGHCIGVDPYYLIHKAQRVGVFPELISAARRINDSMPEYVIGELLRSMAERGMAVRSARIVVLGLSFKENCADLRNTRVAEIVAGLQALGAEVAVHDPRVDAAEAEREYGIRVQDWATLAPADVLLAAVAHDEYRKLSVADWQARLRPGGIALDLKRVLRPGPGWIAW